MRARRPASAPARHRRPWRRNRPSWRADSRRSSFFFRGARAFLLGAPRQPRVERARTLAMTHPAFAALDALAERAGYVVTDPPVLQPADLFLDLLGEDMRRRAFLVTDPEGRDFCLRPDFTIPVSLGHLERHPGGSTGAYAYRGPVFRYRADGPGEFLQAGFENFGRRDIEAADAEMLALA